MSSIAEICVVRLAGWRTYTIFAQYLLQSCDLWQQTNGQILTGTIIATPWCLTLTVFNYRYWATMECISEITSKRLCSRIFHLPAGINVGRTRYKETAGMCVFTKSWDPACKITTLTWISMMSLLRYWSLRTGQVLFVNLMPEIMPRLPIDKTFVSHSAVRHRKFRTCYYCLANCHAFMYRL